MKIIFFGSTSDSVIVLEKLFSLPNVSIAAVITQPPRPVGRKQIITETPVELWGRQKNIPVLSFPSKTEKPSHYEDEQTVIDTLQPFKADLLVSASYGQKIPTKTITDAQYGGLNVHPSILPRFRGADPVPWAILSGDKQTGVTVVTLSNQFDEGRIITQKKIPILPTDTSDPLRTKLFTIGSQLLGTILASKGLPFKGSPQSKTSTPYARKFTRQDGFEPWEHIQKAFEKADEATRIDRKFRALTPWPGVWTKITIQEGGRLPGDPPMRREKRLKILALHIANDTLILDTVQLEGRNPVAFSQFAAVYFTPASPMR